MTREEMENEMLQSNPKDSEGMTLIEIRHLFEMYQQFGVDGLFYAFGIAYNIGYADARKRKQPA